MAFAFEKLLVYQKSVDCADAICQHTEQFTRGYGFLVDQLNRAALSISANWSEVISSQPARRVRRPTPQPAVAGRAPLVRWPRSRGESARTGDR
jgi:hypothetical protein